MPFQRPFLLGLLIQGYMRSPFPPSNSIGPEYLTPERRRFVFSKRYPNVLHPPLIFSPIGYFNLSRVSFHLFSYCVVLAALRPLSKVLAPCLRFLIHSHRHPKDVQSRSFDSQFPRPRFFSLKKTITQGLPTNGTQPLLLLTCPFIPPEPSPSRICQRRIEDAHLTFFEEDDS